MENLTEFYPAFKQVGLKKTGGKGCAIICKDNDYECKSLNSLGDSEEEAIEIGLKSFAEHYNHLWY